MDPTPSPSPSVILHATHIVSIRLTALHADAWHPGPGGFEARAVHLDGVIDAVLKGAIAAGPGAGFAAQITQFDNPSAAGVPIPGLWTPVALEVGTTVIVFAAVTGVTPAPAALLAEPPAIAVRDGWERPSICLALRHAAGDVSALDLLHAAASSPFGFTFVDYLAAVTPNPAFARGVAFGALLDLMSAPGVTAPVRGALVSVVISTVRGGGGFSDRHLNRLIIALLRLAVLGPAGELRGTLLTVDIPILTGVRGGELRSAAAVFSGDPADRLVLLSALRKQPDWPGAARLIQWLGGAF